MVSQNGGSSWSEIMDAGDHGMRLTEDDQGPFAWPEATDNFGAIVDAESRLHSLVALNINYDNNPLRRLAGNYDIITDPEGNVSYHLVNELRGGEYIWSDVGLAENGNLVTVVLKSYERNEIPWCRIEAFYSADGGQTWSENPYILADSLQTTHVSPHITPRFRDSFWVLYQKFNPETMVYDQYVVRSTPNLSERDRPEYTGISTPDPNSYGLVSVDPIALDLRYGYLYFTVLTDLLANPAVAGRRLGRQEWVVDTLVTPAAYPSIFLYTDPEEGGTPYVFGCTNNAVPGQPDYTWYSYCGLGYGTHDWSEPVGIDSMIYDGMRTTYSGLQAIRTSDGRIITGNNLWGVYKPEGFCTNYSDDGGFTWQEPQPVWSIVSDGFAGSSLSECLIRSGPDNTLWVAFAGAYGFTDFEPPTIENVNLESCALEQAWVVTADVQDADSELGEGLVHYTREVPITLDLTWGQAPVDSVMRNEEKSTFYFTIPSDTLLGEAVAEGDTIWFVVTARDEHGNLTRTIEHNLIAGRGWNGVTGGELVPVKFSLGQNYPNPFNSTTVIPFNLDQRSEVRLAVYNLQGQFIETLVSGQINSGSHRTIWHGSDQPTGVYFYRLETSQTRQVGKMMLIR